MNRILVALLVTGCVSAPQPATAPAAATKPAKPTEVEATPAPPAGPAPAEVVAEPRQLDAETELKTPSGATFTLAKGWFITERADSILLQDPEKELAIALYELAAESGEAAIADGWKRHRPDFARPVYQTNKPPAREPWDEIVQVLYDVPAAEARGVMATARRADKTWFVSLLDGTNAAFGRRGAQLGQALNSLKPVGREEESLAGRKAHPFDAARAAQLEAFIQEWQPKAKVPGLAVVLVQDGKLVFEKGFGERELGKGGKVTPDTAFLIGSVSKSLTSLMMARLVDQGRFGWDTPVKALLPSFALGDAAATEKLAMKHTVCACTGLPRQDMEFIFEFAKVTPEKRFAELATMKPTTGFGETFQYSNALVSAGGYVAAKTLQPKAGFDAAYRAAMDQLVFKPLGMRSSTFDFQRAARLEHATPHGLDLTLSGKPLPLSYETAVGSVAPAGGAWSTARDMARYVQLELSKGVGPDGKRLVSEAALLARRQPQTKVSDKAAYGLALFLEQDRKLFVASHGGNTLGMTADVFFIPEANVGGVVLTNAQAANSFTRAIRNRLMELWFDAKPRATDGIAFGVTQREAGMAKERQKLADPPDAAWLGQFAGAWRNEALGELVIRAEGGGFTADAGEWKTTLGEYKEADGSRLVYFTGPPVVGMGLIPREHEGQPALVLETEQQRYVFTRASPPKAAR